MRRTRFQQGSLQIVKRAGGRNAWEYRWYELQADGSSDATQSDGWIARTISERDGGSEGRRRTSGRHQR